MGRYLKALLWLTLGAAVLIVTFLVLTPSDIQKKITRPAIGQILDSLDGIAVYYNGSISNESGRNTTADGYNMGLKYQCVEFVKRYYYYHYHHKMPETWGNAVDLFDTSLQDGELNQKRALLQFSHPSISKPQKGDILIYSGTPSNSFGHVCLVSKVEPKYIEIIQQNPGPYAKSRVKFGLSHTSQGWVITNERILGWLRLP